MTMNETDPLTPGRYVVIWLEDYEALTSLAVKTTSCPKCSYGINDGAAGWACVSCGATGQYRELVK